MSLPYYVLALSPLKFPCLSFIHVSIIPLLWSVGCLLVPVSAFWSCTQLLLLSCLLRSLGHSMLIRHLSKLLLTVYRHCWFLALVFNPFSGIAFLCYVHRVHET